MAGRPEDAVAPTLAQTAPEPRSSRPVIERLSAGAMIGRYLLVERLGAGAMGVVWSAHDPQLDRRVAIKLVHPALARSEEAASRLLREARAMAKLSHRGVVTVHDAGEVDGQLFLAMEMVDGTNLGTMLRARTPGPIADWLRWLDMLIEAGRGLEAAHRAGMLHRDFKPDNVLVDDSGRVCVGDFGLATLGDDGSGSAAASRRDLARAVDLTTTGALLGTPAYMSPQALRGEVLDARTDQFSFCVATWEAIYGQRPFVVPLNTIEAVPELIALIDAGALPPAPTDSLVSAEVRAVVARGLMPNPDDRWLDIGGVLEALARATRAHRSRLSAVVSVPTPPPPPRSRSQVVVAIGLAAGVAAVVLAFALGRRGAPVEAPPTPAAALQPTVTAKRLFGASLRSGLALSPDGTRAATNSDRLHVRELDGPRLWSALLPKGVGEVMHLEFDGDALRFASRSAQTIFRWRYAGDGQIVTEVDQLGGAWRGTTTDGELVWREHDRTLLIVRDGHVVRRWQLETAVESIKVSPDRRRLAYFESGRFSGTLVVRDVARDEPVATLALIEPTAVAWQDATSLLYSTGTSIKPTLWRATVSDGGLGPATAVYGLETGWMGQLVARGERVLVTQMQPSPRARLVDRTSTAVTTRDLDHASVSLAWLSEDEFLAWSRHTHRLERRGLRVATELSQALLDGEPANATLAGELAIASMRRPGGRETVAISRVDGRTRWRHDDLRTHAVRCAADQMPPCLAIRALEAGDQLVTIDPATGALGSTVLYEGKIEDVAIDATGLRVLLAGPLLKVLELDLTGRVVASHAVPSTTIRSVAWDPRGGFLYGATVSRNRYMVGQKRDGVAETLLETDDDILSLVRPSPDGGHVLLLARLYAPEIWQVDLATPIERTP